MSFYKKYAVVRSSKPDDILEEFASMEAAEKFMIMMQTKGEQVTIVTDEEDTPNEETPDEFVIEGLELDEPSVEFGSDLDQFNEEEGFFDVEVDDDGPDVDFD